MKNLLLILLITISTILTGQSNWTPILKAPTGSSDNFFTDSKGDLFYTAAGLYFKGNSEPGIIQLSKDTVWSKIGLLDSASDVISSVIDNKGNIFVCGTLFLTNTNGTILNYSQIAKWDGKNWSEIHPSKDYYDIKKITVNSKGELYVIGEFTNFSKVNGADYIAKWDGSKWTKVGSSVDAPIAGIAIDKKDNVYIIGGFKKSGNVVLNNVALLKNDTWSALGKGCTDTFWSSLGAVRAISLDNNDNLWIGGLFDEMDGDKSVKKACYWNGSKWVGATTDDTVGFVFGLAFDAQNNPYLITNTNTGGGNTSLYTIKNNKYVAFFNSNSNNFNTIYFDKVKNRLYTAGYFPSIKALCYMAYLQLSGVNTNDAQLGSSIKVTPNPFQNEIRVNVSEKINRLSVTDATGRLITVVSNPTEDIIINTEAWSNGVYFVTVEKDGRQFSTKIVRN